VRADPLAVFAGLWTAQAAGGRGGIKPPGRAHGSNPQIRCGRNVVAPAADSAAAAGALRGFGYRSTANCMWNDCALDWWFHDSSVQRCSRTEMAGFAQTVRQLWRLMAPMCERLIGEGAYSSLFL